MRYELIKAKSLLSKKKIEADSWFHINRSFNAYRGCEHGCVYCDGMADNYHVDNFLTHIRGKENAPELLRKELKKEGYYSHMELVNETLWSFLDPEDAKKLSDKGPIRQIIGVCGGVSDGYQPAEKKFEITRKLLAVLLDYGMPIFVLSKSDLVLRDLDILKEIHKKSYANVVFTITLANDRDRAIFEPRASSTPERFKALRKTRSAGLFGGVMSTPIIPGIGDNYDNMTALAKEAKNVNAEFILFSGMTLKPGRQKEYFLNVIRQKYPEKLALLEKIFSNNDRYGTPLYKYMPVHIALRGHKVCRDIGISDRSIRHRIHSEYETNNLVLGVLLDIIYQKSHILGRWREIKPFQELSIKIERGVDDIGELHQSGKIKEILMIEDPMVEIVEEIIDTGKYARIHELINEALENPDI
ncbi:MAG: radical SAM protein [Candidatus Thorarchaeota archaeon]